MGDIPAQRMSFEDFPAESVPLQLGADDLNCAQPLAYDPKTQRLYYTFYVKLYDIWSAIYEGTLTEADQAEKEAEIAGRNAQNEEIFGIIRQRVYMEMVELWDMTDDLAVIGPGSNE